MPSVCTQCELRGSKIFRQVPDTREHRKGRKFSDEYQTHTNAGRDTRISDGYRTYENTRTKTVTRMEECHGSISNDVVNSVDAFYLATVGVQIEMNLEICSVIKHESDFCCTGFVDPTGYGFLSRRMTESER